MRGVRVIARAEGVYVGGGGRNANASDSVYTTLFQTATPAQIELGSILAKLTSNGLKYFLLYSFGSGDRRAGRRAAQSVG